MKIFGVIVCAVLYLGLATTESFTNDRKREVDLVIEGLEEQKWLKDEQQCLDETLLILNNVQNYTVWAVWIWNSMQHPVGSFYGSKYSLGNYDQCLKAPSNFAEPNIVTQYCLTDVKLTDREEKKYGSANVYVGTENYLNVRSREGRKLDVITWGACLPAACDHHSVSKILKAIYLVNPITSVDPNITVEYCQKAGTKNKFSFEFYAFIMSMLVLIGTTFLSTFYVTHDSQDTRMSRVAYAFSLKRNWSSFTRMSDEDIPVLSFTKTATVILITIVHVFVFIITGAISNGNDFDDLISVKNNAFENTIRHIDLIVDNFFVISGLLLMKGLMEKKKKPVIMLIQRYIRLITSFSVLIFYTVAVSDYTGDGPLWNRLNGIEQKACSKNWLISLLMLNNYVDGENICQVVSWYVPCDYHLAILGTALYCIWQWDRRIGKVSTTVVVLLAVLVPGITTYWNRLPGLLLYDVEKMINSRSNDVYVGTYIKSHHRAGPYLLGMAMGYIMMVYRPAKYRGVISKQLSYIGFAAAFLLGFRVLTAAPEWCLGEYNAWNTAVYAVFNRNIWALAICACIGISEYGNVGTIRNIMAWPGFTIFSRLAYGVYITHSLILERNIYSQRNPMQYDMFGLILNGFGVLTASALLAALLWLFVESPLSNLANLILNPKTKQTSNGIEYKKKMNGQAKDIDFKNTKAL